jgi:hypothetical protein
MKLHLYGVVARTTSPIPDPNLGLSSLGNVPSVEHVIADSGYICCGFQALCSLEPLDV